MEASIADRVRVIREARGFSQAELARRASLSKSSVSDIEGSSDRSPSIGTLGAIADALEVHVGTLIGVLPLGGAAVDIEELTREAFADRAAGLGFSGVAAPDDARFFRAATGIALCNARIQAGDLLIVRPLMAGRGMVPCIVERRNPVPAFEPCLFADPYLIGPSREGTLTSDMVQNPAIKMVGEIAARLGKMI